ncbi:hypothetical protein L596_011932 [Steinernema carpocapsae]|uniref:Uncharacterized protein n=1 Tax=Steinernema carpocapsae TaxID=34508 RepID=A0A4V6A4M7_STECR|nr:hypothetical protein L596_011932 [Steinernema carpocapsae]
MENQLRIEIDFNKASGHKIVHVKIAKWLMNCTQYAQLPFEDKVEYYEPLKYKKCFQRWMFLKCNATIQVLEHCDKSNYLLKDEKDYFLIYDQTMVDVNKFKFMISGATEQQTEPFSNVYTKFFQNI